jgi:hypothetical protein
METFINVKNKINKLLYQKALLCSRKTLVSFAFFVHTIDRQPQGNTILTGSL